MIKEILETCRWSHYLLLIDNGNENKLLCDIHFYHLSVLLRSRVSTRMFEHTQQA